MENLKKKLLKIISENPPESIKSTIANFIINNLEFIRENQTNKIAKKCNVSPSSIIRFCQSLGLDGINELKFIIKNMDDKYPAKDDETENEKKYFEIIQDGFKNLTTELKWNKRIIKWFSKDKNVYLFAFNVSFFASKNFVQRARVRGYNVFLEDDISTIDWYIEHIKYDDVIIFVTLSGLNLTLQNFAKSARDKCKIFAVLGETHGFENEVQDYFLIKNKEAEFWSLYSIRSQLLQQLWDLVLIQL